MPQAVPWVRRCLFRASAFVSAALCALLLAVVNNGKAVAAEPGATPTYTVESVLDHLTKSRELISNVTIKCTWISRSADGKNNTWEEQTFIWDDLGRRRILSQTWPLTKDGTKANDDKDHKAHTTDTIFDGEVIAYSQDYPQLNRVGEVPKEGEKAGYNPVIIGDAASTLRSDLESQRNPFEYTRNAAIPAIRNGIKNGKVTVSAPDAQGNIQVDIEYTKSNSGVAKSVITIAPKHQWQIESMRSFSSTGSLISEIVFEYKQQSDGLWVPAKGRHVIWGDQSTAGEPALDWRFEVHDVKFNDPAFSDSIFRIKLRPDAAVSDTRYNIAYRVGDQELTTSELAKYAADARKAAEEADAKRRRGKDYSEDAAGTSKWRQFLLILNIIIVVVASAMYVMLRLKRRHSSA